MSIFDEYEESTNGVVKFGLLYNHRVLSDGFIEDDLAPKDVRNIVNILKLETIKAIKDDIDKEYNLLKELYQYEEQGVLNV